MFTIVAERVKEHIFFLKRCLAWNIYIFLMHLLACTCNQNFLLPIRISCFKLVDINNCTVWHIIFLFLKPCMLCILKLRKLCEFSLNIPFSMIFLYLELYMLVEEKIQDLIPLLRHLFLTWFEISFICILSTTLNYLRDVSLKLCLNIFCFWIVLINWKFFIIVYTHAHQICFYWLKTKTWMIMCIHVSVYLGTCILFVPVHWFKVKI